MGQHTILTQHQIDILNTIAEDTFLSDTFYFSGGTALSEVYLHHRESVDLDFFSPHTFTSQSLVERIITWSKKRNFDISSEYIEPTHIFFLDFHDGNKLKIDFAHYPYRQLDPLSLLQNGIRVDSLKDIAANKLFTTTQRVEVKDYVDMYFLFQHYTFWDMRDWVAHKFKVRIDPYIFASDCMTVDEFIYLPKMIKPLSLSTLQSFYHKLSKQIAGKQTE